MHTWFHVQLDQKILDGLLDSNGVKFWAQCKFALTVSYPWNDDSSNGDFDPRILEQFVPQIDAIPKTDDISFNGNIVFTMQPRKQSFKLNK